MDTQEKLSGTTISLHWIVACSMMVLLSTGLYMSNTETWTIYPLHKSLGVIALPIALLRVIWRLRHGWPTAIRDYSKIEKNLAKLVHCVLLIGTVAMPLTGMLFSAASGHGFGIFGMEIYPANPDPLKSEDVIARSKMWADIGENMHGIIGYTLIVALVLHMAGAIKHHFFDSDGTLMRMLGRKI